ncbi:coatomer subunit delta, partial [Conglomerata obtusa]
ECFVNGDLSIKVRKEEFRKEEIEIITKNLSDLKCSPNLSKDKFKNGVLFSERGYPLNKNVALMKWKKKIDCPFDFSFWVSENNDNKYSVQFEIENKKKVKDLNFYFNKKKDVIVENARIVDGKYEWEGKNGTVEILCDNYEDIFPVTVDLWNDEFDPFVNVKENEKMRVVKITEVE